MKIFGTFLATFALSLTFAFAQTATTDAAPATEKKACSGEAKAACCAGKTEKACCKSDAKGHADAINTKDAKPVMMVEEETVVRTPGGNGRRVVQKSHKNASMKPQATKE